VTRRRVAGPAGLALLLAGGALLIRVAVLSLSGEQAHGWLFTAAACVLAGVALVLVTLPKIAPSQAREGATEPSPELPRG
jgi:peptidoglycan/LPS O-acetylase OafA/YrhL